MFVLQGGYVHFHATEIEASSLRLASLVLARPIPEHRSRVLSLGGESGQNIFMEFAMERLEIGVAARAPAGRRVRSEYFACVQRALRVWNLPDDLEKRIFDLLFSEVSAPWVAPAEHAAVMSVVTSAQDRLRLLGRSDLIEMGMARIPASAMALSAATICLLLDVQPICEPIIRCRAAGAEACASEVTQPSSDQASSTSWTYDYCQPFATLFSQPDMVAAMLAHDRDSIPDEVATGVRPYLSRPELDSNNLRRYSSTYDALINWARATMLYHDACIVAYEHRV